MSAKTYLSQAPRGLESDLVPSDPARNGAEAELDLWAEGPDRPPTPYERRAYAIVQFGFQGVLMLAVATIFVGPLAFVPSCSAKAWPILKTVLLMDAIAYLALALGLLLFIGQGMRSTPDAV